MPRPAQASQQARVLAPLVARRYTPVDTPLLAPASLFLDFSGEEIRAGLFLTSDGSGTELCLRPDFTIPVCRAYLDSGLAGQRAAFSYCGPVFRARPGQSGERLQAGLESFGRTDIAAADAEILAVSLDAAAAGGFRNPAIQLGDAGLLARMFDVLALPDSLKRRVKRGLDKGHALDRILTQAPSLGSDHSGVIAALTGTDASGARALVEDLLSIAGIASVGGRTAAEIAERFLTQVASKATPAFAGERRAVLERFLAIRGTPDEVSADVRRLADEARLDLGAALDLFDDRANFIAAHGVDIDAVRVETAFGRNLAYYTGFVFEVRAAGAPADGDVVVGGGRYDRLTQSLGSAGPIPAVGAAIWVDRLPPAPEAADE